MYSFTLEDLRKIWGTVYDSMHSVFSSSTLELWFGSVRMLWLDDKFALLAVDKAFKKSFIDEKYMDVLKEHFFEVLGFDVDIEIIAGIPEVKNEEEAEVLYKKYKAKHDDEISKENADELAAAIQQISPDKEKRSLSYYTFENFIVGESNKFAYHACYAVANNEDINYNPLFIHGKSGLGKTHLMYAILNKLFSRNRDLKVIYIRGEEFTNQLVEAIKNGTTDAFRGKYRTADVLLVDDIQFIAGKTATQDEFFNTFNTLYEAEKQIIVTCDRPIKDMKHLEERIRTRLEWGLTVDITSPDLELRMAIIRKKAEEVNLSLPEEIIEYMAKKLRDNVRVIEGGVKKLSALHFIMGRPINMSIAEDAIADLVCVDLPRSNKIEKVLMETCDKFNISKDSILSKKRSANITMARHFCMYTLREAISMTYQEIADVFSCDHSSVMSAIKKIEREKQNVDFNNDIELFIGHCKTLIEN